MPHPDRDEGVGTGSRRSESLSCDAAACQDFVELLSAGPGRFQVGAGAE